VLNVREILDVGKIKTTGDCIKTSIDVCQQVVARIVFEYHECRPLGVDGLELTDHEE
jgi:hypothetical protein